MKAVVATFNQEKALVGAFSVIVQPVVEPMDRFAALIFTQNISVLHGVLRCARQQGLGRGGGGAGEHCGERRGGALPAQS